MYKNSLRNTVIPLVVAVAIVGGILIGRATMRSPSNVKMVRLSGKSYADNKLIHTLSLIDKLYVDSVNMDSISQNALIRVVEELDPHSAYIASENFAAANEGLDGEFDGIGVVFNMTTDTVVVLNVISGGPSDKAGVRNGDRIIMVGDSVVAGQKIKQTDIMKMLRGKRDTKVDISLMRQGISDLIPVTVTRGVIPIKSLDAAFMIRPNIGFIKLSTFSRNSHSEIIRALTTLKEQGMKGLIFDLRGNGGGFLDQAISIANEFLPSGNMIVYTEDRHKRREVQNSNGSGKFTDLELVILVDEGSASSSEILAGAIQDNDRGTILGRRTFGKGLVQQQIPFEDGSALRLTVARYYTPTGRSIQRPYSDGKEEYGMDLRHRIDNNELFSADSIKFTDSLKFTTPGGKIVYGGGGIMPDIFMPIDTTKVTPYFMEVSGRNILYNYTLYYGDRHRDALNAVVRVGQLDSLLNADTTILDDFIRYASSKGIKPNYRDINISREILVAQLRASIGRNTPLEDVGFYANIYPIDKAILKGLEILEGEKSN